MLAHALSQSYANAGLSNKFKLTRPAPPPNSPLLAEPKIVIDRNSEADGQEEGENDGIDFSRLRAELDRLLEEGVQESDDDAIKEGQDFINIAMHHQANRTGTTIKVHSTERLSRSL